MVNAAIPHAALSEAPLAVSCLHQQCLRNRRRRRPPRGFRKFDPVTEVPIVWKMKTPLYGQGDAGLVWFRTIKNQLTNVQSFNQSDSDPSYFWKRT